MKTALKWGVAALGAGIAFNMIVDDKLDRDGKFLGLFEDSPGIGFDTAAQGAVILGTAFAFGWGASKFFKIPKLIPTAA